MSRNSIVENAPKIPPELKWELVCHSMNSETKITTSFYPFEDFDSIIFKQQKPNNLWLVELVRDNSIYFGYAKIVKK